MTAPRATAEGDDFQYYFQEVTGRPGGQDSGWISENRYLDSGLQPDTEYAYTVRMRDTAGNVTPLGQPLPVRTDTELFEIRCGGFDTDHDFLTRGISGTEWDGFVGQGPGESVRTLDIQDGRLRLASENTDWAFGTPRGPFLFRHGQGDFLVQVQVADALGLRERSGYGNNETGLMLRVAGQDSVEEERHFSISVFPAWGCGNLWTNRRGAQRPQGNNQQGLEADRYLQIQKTADLLYVRTSPDGQSWTELRESPFVRTDMQAAVLQVGLYHATYGDRLGYGEFQDFRLIRRRSPQP